MSLLDNYQGFLGAVASGAVDELARYVDPDAYTETCVGLTGWTVGLDVALANFHYGIATAFADFASEARDVVETEEALVIRSRGSATHVGPFLGVAATGRQAVWDAVDMVRAGPDGRIESGRDAARRTERR